jgi:hypothetical protein
MSNRSQWVERRACVDPNVRFHAKVPPLALASLVHLTIALTLPVLGRRGRRVTFFLAGYSSSAKLAGFIMCHPAHATPILPRRHPVRLPRANKVVKRTSRIVIVNAQKSSRRVVMENTNP